MYTVVLCPSPLSDEKGAYMNNSAVVPYISVTSVVASWKVYIASLVICIPDTTVPT